MPQFGDEGGGVQMCERHGPDALLAARGVSRAESGSSRTPAL
jgi:hypothetical protein